jgi:N-acetylmuramoyl-L-alanine amidase
MKQRFGSMIAMILAMLGLSAYAFAEDARRGQPAPQRAAGESSHDPAGALNSQEAARLTAVRVLPSENGTRVLMELSRAVRYEVGRLPEDNSRGVPPRIYVDIADAKLAMDSLAPIHVQGGGIRQIRVGQFTNDTVRVVLDMSATRDHTAFLLAAPFSVVLDIHGSQGAKPFAPQAQAEPLLPGAIPAKSAKTQATGIRKIVLDPGHGGKDPGAIGVDGFAEKDIVLSVAKKLAAKLKKEMGVQVVLTRTDDRFIALEDRTAVANAEDADLFISLHMNASHNGEARGIETYYLDNTTDEASIRLAARENSTSRKKISDLQFILSDMTQNLKLEDSVSLAHRLQSSVVSTLGGHMREVRDLGVKKALFYVLVGARMPSVLVEMFFITHREEGRAMSQHKLQDAMADALYEGIQQYHRSVLAAKTL